jgi:hypothetical protein
MRKQDAPVAQLDRASPSEGEGHRFESCRVRQLLAFKLRIRGSGVRISSGAPFPNKTGHSCGRCPATHYQTFQYNLGHQECLQSIELGRADRKGFVEIRPDRRNARIVVSGGVATGRKRQRLAIAGQVRHRKPKTVIEHRWPPRSSVAPSPGAGEATDGSRRSRH